MNTEKDEITSQAYDLKAQGVATPKELSMSKAREEVLSHEDDLAKALSELGILPTGVDIKSTARAISEKESEVAGKRVRAEFEKLDRENPVRIIVDGLSTLTAEDSQQQQAIEAGIRSINELRNIILSEYDMYSGGIFRGLDRNVVDDTDDVIERMRSVYTTIPQFDRGVFHVISSEGDRGKPDTLIGEVELLNTWWLGKSDEASLNVLLENELRQFGVLSEDLTLEDYISTLGGSSIDKLGFHLHNLKTNVPGVTLNLGIFSRPNIPTTESLMILDIVLDEGAIRRVVVEDLKMKD